MNSEKKNQNTPMIVAAVAGIAIGAVSFASIQSRNSGTTNRFDDTRAVPRAVSSESSVDISNLKALDGAFTDVVKYVSPAVVNISARASRGTDEMGNFTGQAGGTGSGVIFRENGWIITNDHVVAGFDDVTVTLNDGREFKGKIFRAENRDLAVVKIEATNLPTVKFANSNEVRPGQYAIAVGSPFGLENSVTIGHVSGLARNSTVPDPRYGYRTYPDLIQTDAAVNMGNSGGPLFNINGEVIGINTAILSRTGGNEGISFAIPANQVRTIAEILISDGKVNQGYLGVSLAELKPYKAKELGISQGAYVSDIPSNGPAAEAGLKKGDVITKIGDTEVTNQSDLRNSMFRYKPGQTVGVDVYRNGGTQQLKIKIAELPDELKLQRPQVQQNRTAPRQNEGSGNDLQDFMKDNRGFKFPDIKNQDDYVPPVREGKAKLGVQVEDLNATNRKQFNIPGNATGAVIINVVPGSVAEKLGFKAGDVIMQLGSKEIKSSKDITEAMQGINWGDNVKVRAGRYSEGGSTTMSWDVPFR